MLVRSAGGGAGTYRPWLASKHYGHTRQVLFCKGYEKFAQMACGGREVVGKRERERQRERDREREREGEGEREGKKRAAV